MYVNLYQWISVVLLISLIMELFIALVSRYSLPFNAIS